MNVKNSIKKQILSRIGMADPLFVWTPTDFLDIGTRDAVDKTLQRLSINGMLRRISRGLYDIPLSSVLLYKTAPPQQDQVLAAVARRNDVGTMCDGMTAANRFGLTHAVPAHIHVYTNKRIKSLKIQNLDYTFVFSSSRKMSFWHNRPSADFIQAVFWLKPMVFSNHGKGDPLFNQRITHLLSQQKMAPIFSDIQTNFHKLPKWIQHWLACSIFQSNSL